MENSTDRANVVTAGISDEPFHVYVYYFMRQIFAGMCVATSIMGVTGNALVIISVCLSKKLRTVTNVFVVNLSVSDLLACSVLSWQAVAVLSEDGWPLPGLHWICSGTVAILLICGMCSVNNLALIALHRRTGITKSSGTVRRIYTPRNLALMVAFSWLFPVCVTLVPPLFGIGELGYEPIYGSCSWLKSNRFSLLQNAIVGTMSFPVQLTIIGTCYTSIFRYVLETSRRMARHDTKTVSGELTKSDQAMRKMRWKRQIAVTKNLVYIVVAYVICYTPFFVSIIPFGYDWSIRMTTYAGAIAFFNSCINPIIYATTHPDFKEVFGYMARCQCRAIPRTSAVGRSTRSSPIIKAK